MYGSFINKSADTLVLWAQHMLKPQTSIMPVCGGLSTINGGGGGGGGGGNLWQNKHLILLRLSEPFVLIWSSIVSAYPTFSPIGCVQVFASTRVATKTVYRNMTL